jgi:hypothetical protein
MSPIVVECIDFLRARMGAVKAVFFGALAFFVLYDVFASRHEPHFVGDQIRGFWALFGFLGCVIMARFMKGLGHLWLMKPLDFYSRHDSGEE